MRADYDRSLALDPENVQTRLEYAGVLEALRCPPSEAHAEGGWYNDQLAPDEIERLPAARGGEITAKIVALQPAATLRADTTPASSPPATRPM